jgi:hypothetical protein
MNKISAPLIPICETNVKKTLIYEEARPSKKNVSPPYGGFIGFIMTSEECVIKLMN